MLFLSIGLTTGIILAIIGCLIKYKKAYWLISGYNTMSAEKKKNVHIEGLGRFVSSVCFVIATIIFVATIFIALGKNTESVIVFALLLPVIIYTLINAQKYDGNARNDEGKMKKGTKLLIGLIISFLVLVAIGVCFLLYFSNIPAEYTLQNGILNISGMYGQEIPIYDISSLELKETLPAALLRTNGSALGNMYKGYFKLKDISKAMLFLNVSKPPFIYLRSNTQTIILNCNDSEKTKILYEKLHEEWVKQ